MLNFRSAFVSSWRAAQEYLQHGAARVVSQHGADARSAAGLLRAVAEAAPMAACQQFLADRRGVDCQGSCSPQGIVETLLSELRLLPLWSALAELALPSRTPQSATGPAADGAGPSNGREAQPRDGNGMRTHSRDESCRPDCESRVQTPDNVHSGSGSADCGGLGRPAEQDDDLVMERLCTLLLLVPSETWDSVADPQVCTATRCRI